MAIYKSDPGKPTLRPPPKKKKKKPVGIGGQIGAGVKAPAPQSPSPKPTPPDGWRAKPQPKPTLPKVVTPPAPKGLKALVGSRDPLDANINNMSTVFKSKFGSLPTPDQAMAMLNTVDYELSAKEWGLYIAPGLSTDPFTSNLVDKTRQYYDLTGHFPSPKAAREILSGEKPMPSLDMPGNIPLPGIDGTDLSIYDVVVSGAGSGVTPGRAGHPHARWSKEDLRRLKSLGLGTGSDAADVERHEANTTIHGDKMSLQTQSDIWKARGWYVPTSLKKKIEHRAELALQATAASHFVNPDGSDNLPAINLIAKLTGQKTGALNDPSTFTGLRHHAKGKRWDKLPKGIEGDVQSFGSRLSQLYPQFKPDPTSGKYTWNTKFDRYASMFLFAANIGAATTPNIYDEKTNPEAHAAAEKSRQLAQANISIASHGGIKTTDNMNDWLQQSGFLGKKGEPGMFSDQFTSFLFDSYQKTIAVPNEPLVVSIYNFARLNGGKESLPVKYQKYYDDIKSQWGSQVGAQVGAEAVNPLHAIFSSELTALQQMRQSYIPDLPQDTTSITPGTMAVKPISDKARRAMKSAQQAGSGPAVYKLDENGNIITREATSGVGGRPIMAMSGRRTVDPDDSFAMWMEYHARPKIAALTDDILNGVTRQIGRIYLFAAMLGDTESGSHTSVEALFPVPQEGGYIAKAKIGGNSARDISVAASKANPLNLTIPTDPQQYAWHNITASWSEAGRKAGDLSRSPYMRYEFEKMGVDPDEHGGLLFWADMGWQLGTGYAMDAGIGAIAKAGLTTTAKVMRSLMSEKLAAKVAVAETNLGELAARQEALVTNAEYKRLHAVADTMEDSYPTLAKGLRERADRLATGSPKGLLPELTPDEAAEYTLSAFTKRGRTGGVLVKTAGKRSAMLDNEDYITLMLDRRPAWYDTFSGGLARQKLTGAQAEHVLGIKESHIGFSMRNEYNAILDEIGLSNDGDRILELMNRLNVKHGLTLDPGAIWLGKLHHLDAVTRGSPLASATKVIANDIRIPGGIRDVGEHVRTIGKLTSMGLTSGQERQANDLLWGFIERLRKVPGVSPAEVNLNRQTIWKEFNATIEENMRGYVRDADGVLKTLEDGTKVTTRPVTAKQMKKITYWAHKNGMGTDGLEKVVKTEWDAFNAFRVIKNTRGRIRTLGRAFGDTKTAWYNDVQSGVPYELSGKGGYMGQQANDLVSTFNYHDLVSWQHGGAWNQLAQYAPGGFIGYGPSFMGMVNAGRTLAVSTFAFPFSALFIDEFWRFGPELAKGNISVKGMLTYRKMTKGKGLREAAGNAFDEMLSTSHSVVPIMPGEASYGGFLNNELQSMTQGDLWDQYMVWRSGLVTDVGEDAFNAMDGDAKRELLKSHLVNWVLGEGDDSVAFRNAMQSTGRGFKGLEGNQAEIAAAEQDYIARSERLTDDFQKARTERNVLVKDRTAILDREIEVPVAKKIVVPSSVTDRVRDGVFAEFKDRPRTFDTNVAYYKWSTNPSAETFRSLKKALLDDLRNERKTLTQPASLTGVDMGMPASRGTVEAVPQARPANYDEALESWKSTSVDPNSVGAKTRAAMGSETVSTGSGFATYGTIHKPVSTPTPSQPALTAEQFIEEFNAKNGVRTLQGGSTESASDVRWYLTTVDENTVNLDTIKAFKTREGHGSKILDNLEADADKNGITITLTAQPLGKADEKMTTSDLMAYYEKRGYVEVEPGTTNPALKNVMERKPVGSVSAPSGPVKLEDFMDEFLSSHNVPNETGKPLTSGFLEGDVRLSLHADEGQVVVTNLEVPPGLRRGGLGGGVIDDLTKAADQAGVTLAVDTVPFGAEKTTKKVLRDMYEKRGFRGSGTRMERKPLGVGSVEGDIADPARLKELDAQIKKVSGTRTPHITPEHTISVEAPGTTTVRAHLSVRSPTSKSWIARWMKENLGIEVDTAAIKGTDTMTEEEARAFLKTHLPKSKEEYNTMFDKWRSVAWFRRQKETMPNDLYDSMRDDWSAEVLALRGATESGIKQEYDDATLVLEAKRREVRGIGTDMRQHHDTRKPARMTLDDPANVYIDSYTDRLTLVNKHPELYRSATKGKALSKKQVDSLIAEGVSLPQVHGVREAKSGWLQSNGSVGWVPGLSGFAASKYGPYALLNAMGNATRKIAFLGNFSVEYPKLLRAGYTADDALEAATARALQYTDKIMYSAGSSPLESDLGGMFYFLPAYRQATKYWAAQVVKNPIVYGKLREAFQTDIPMAYGPNGIAGNWPWLADYGTYIPMPFWMTNSPSEAVVPGLTAPILAPLRLANTLSGWRSVPTKDETGHTTYKMEYTGQTSLDWVSNNTILSPLTGFASKNVSPTSLFDDLLYGAFGEGSYGSLSADGTGGELFYSLGMSMRKDPMTRRKTAASIMLAQIAAGDKPNTDVYAKKMAGSPWWYNMLAGFHFDQPEAILAAITRQLTPRKLLYSPQDIGIVAHPTDTDASRNVFDRFNLFNSIDARTIVDAEYEYYKEDGNPDKQRQILEKYPKLAAKMEFFRKNAYEREQYLMKQENQWLIPYVTGKTAHGSDGSPLTNGEYYRQMTSGAMRRKENSQLIKDISLNYVNADWAAKNAVLTKTRDDALKANNKWFMAAVKKYAVNDRQRASFIQSVTGYVNGWWGEGAPSQYGPAQPEPGWVLRSLAIQTWGKNHYLEHQNIWDAQAIKQNYDDLTKTLGFVDTTSDNYNRGVEGTRPEGANLTGLLGHYTNYALSDWKALGDVNRISDAVKTMVQPDDRKLFTNSISAKTIKENTKKFNDSRNYQITKILTNPYYYQDGAATLETAMPGIYDPSSPNFVSSVEDMDLWLRAASDAYSIKTAAAGEVGLEDYYSDAYDKAKKQYDRTMARLFKRPEAAPFRMGTAGTLLYTYLTDPGDGGSWDKGYAAKVVKAIGGKSPEYNDLVLEYNPKGANNPKQALSANAWASTLNGAIALQKRIKDEREHNPDGGHIGDVTRESVRKLKRYVSAWSHHSSLFKSQWLEQGGDKMIGTLLASVI